MALAQERSRPPSTRLTATAQSGANILGSDFSVDIVVHPGAGAYIAGDETGLLESLEGKRALPRIKPPNYPAAIGLYGAPTVVNNVETLSNLAWIMRNGSDAFDALGRAPPGDQAAVPVGPRAPPRNYEIEFAKVSFRELIYDPELGGGIRHDRQLKAFIPGGASSPWFGPQHLDVFLANEKIAEAGSMAGSGSITAMDETTCPVRAGWRITRFFHRESCGQCTPVPGGLGLDREDHAPHRGWPGSRSRPGPPDGRVRQHLARCELAAGADDNLPLGPSIPSSIASGIRMFRDEFLDHIRTGQLPFPA